jgi:hypothetical protein
MTRALLGMVIAVNGLFLGCSGSGDAAEPSAPPVRTEDAPAETANPATPASPASATDFRQLLQDRSYRGWTSESKVHPSAGPHGGNVRTYLNDSLFASLSAGNAEHPKGSVAVKELYSSGTETVTGWAVMEKTEDSSNGGQGWYWYEVFSTEPGSANTIEGQGKSLCVNCHSGSTRDFVLAPFPLQ